MTTTVIVEWRNPFGDRKAHPAAVIIKNLAHLFPTLSKVVEDGSGAILTFPASPDLLRELSLLERRIDMAIMSFADKHDAALWIYEAYRHNTTLTPAPLSAENLAELLHDERIVKHLRPAIDAEHMIQILNDVRVAKLLHFEQLMAIDVRARVEAGRILNARLVADRGPEAALPVVITGRKLPEGSGPTSRQAVNDLGEECLKEWLEYYSVIVPDGADCDGKRYMLWYALDYTR